MSAQQHFHIPFERVGPYAFGASASECAQILGPHDRGWDSLCLGDFGKRKLKEGRTAIAYARSQSVAISFLGNV